MDCRGQLRLATAALQLRGLKNAAKWCAEQLAGLDPAASGSGSASFTPSLPPASEALLRVCAADCSDRFLLARSYFDLGEYQRAAFVLQPPASSSGATGSSTAVPSALRGLSGEEVFLKAYALYLGGEKTKEQEALEVADALDRPKAVNPNLRGLEADLALLHEEHALDAFGLYIYGVVLKELGRGGPCDPAARPKVVDAFGVLSASLEAFPWNWSAWLDLATIAVRAEVAPETVPIGLGLPTAPTVATTGATAGSAVTAALSAAGCSPWCRLLFVAHCLIEHGGAEECTNALAVLAHCQQPHLFPSSTYVAAQVALAHYSLRNFPVAEAHFEDLRLADPYRLENLDTYSNILYVKESRAALSHLAHVCMKADKYRPETCCVVGNYYSLKGKHEQAVSYFQRAVKLNRSFLAAWTLMGHEFVEMKNTGAAVEAYRRGVDVNPRDYRAWYGLGQTYELLNMFFYALYYYTKAVKLRPTDARMWCALANCYQRLDRPHDAIRAYERASSNGDAEGIANLELARLWAEQSGSEALAAGKYRDHLDLFDRGPDRPVQRHDGVAEALQFLGQYAKDGGELALAAKYCGRLLECGGQEEDWAKQMLREIKQLERQQAQQAQSARHKA